MKLSDLSVKTRLAMLLGILATALTVVGFLAARELRTCWIPRMPVRTGDRRNETGPRQRR